MSVPTGSSLPGHPAARPFAPDLAQDTEMPKTERPTWTPDLNVGDRVEAAPHTDVWMMGDRFGTVVYIGRTFYRVKMDRSGRTLRFAAHGEMTPC